eukprot:s95_g11.t1
MGYTRLLPAFRGADIADLYKNLVFRELWLTFSRPNFEPQPPPRIGLVLHARDRSGKNMPPSKADGEGAHRGSDVMLIFYGGCSDLFFVTSDYNLERRHLCES